MGGEGCVRAPVTLAGVLCIVCAAGLGVLSGLYADETMQCSSVGLM